jgi:uncharacterized protein YkwD
LRKLVAAFLAVPVLAVIYVPVLLRRSIAVRIGSALVVVGLIAFGAFGFVTPSTTVATPPLAPIVPMTNAAFTSTISAGTELNAPVAISFSAPMDQTSVAASLEIDPVVAVNLAWDTSGTSLTITPKSGWSPATYHTITVRPGALGTSGRPMAVPARAVFLTRDATVGKIEATDLSGTQAQVSTSFRISFDHPVAIEAVRKALSFSPPLAGTLAAVASPSSAPVFSFKPSALLATGVTYRIAIAGLVDVSGAGLAAIPILNISTGAPPHVIRFRPLDRSTNVDRAAVLSVRFSESMDRRTAKSAFSAMIDGKVIAGAVSFAESDRVLIFRPTSLLPYGAPVTIQVNGTATSRLGVPMGSATSVRIAIVPKPTITPAKKPTPKPPSSGSGGGAVGGGSWGALETYYLGLMNCTRQGGNVTSSGACSSPGGRRVAALWLDAGISTKVSRPYAKQLALSGVCSHFSGGTPGNRLSRAGYTSYIWAENLGCQSRPPKSVMIAAAVYFQSERSWNPPGGHYVNMMNPKYDRVGIGVWVAGGRVRLVIDFYHPL